VILGHVIALDPTVEQDVYFRRACGVARFAYNWGLAEWQRLHEAGEKPTAAKIKRKWNAVRKIEFPWSYEVTKCASGQAIIDLGAAFSNFFRDLKRKMVPIGSGAERETDDLMLTRYACYLIAQSADPRKRSVAFAYSKKGG